MYYLRPLWCVVLLSLMSFAGTVSAAGWSSSDSPSNEMSSIKRDIRNQHYEAAIVKLKKLIRSESKNADAYNLLGFSHRKLKQYDVAERLYNEALVLNPKHKGALEYLGELYVETKRIDKAKEMLSRLDEVCYFSCQEYRDLKAVIDKHEQGVSVSMDW